MQRLKITILLSLVTVAVMALAACDPLAPDATPVVIVITSTATRTPVPTQAPSATETPLATTEATASLVPSATSATCGDTKGQIVDLTFNSKVIGTAIKYRAYLPPCYADSTRRYPYVILMPGSDQDDTEWTGSLKINEALDTGIGVQALPPMILIMPDGGDLMNTNIFQEGASWESVILDELMPEIEKNFCTWNDRKGRAIGGISRGGFWAFEIGLRHPDQFSAVGGHSAFFDPDNSGPAYNPMALAKTVRFAPGTQPRLWLDVAKDDDVRTNIEIVQKTFADRGIEPSYTMNPAGEHAINYWAAHVAEYLAFYGQTWPRDVLELPSCLQ
jgi:enterochelin esterase-like enzyme